MSSEGNIKKVTVFDTGPELIDIDEAEDEGVEHYVYFPDGGADMTSSFNVGHDFSNFSQLLKYLAVKHFGVLQDLPRKIEYLRKNKGVTLLASWH